VIELDALDVGALLVSRDGVLDGVEDLAGSAVHALERVDLAPLVVRPGKIICLGLNYAGHVREMGHDPPEYPTLFAKFSGALIGARDPIVLPGTSDRVDFEAELAFVIGRPARHVAVGCALDHIAGFTVLNDVSVRDWQRRTSQWLQGKTFEHTTPIGPMLVTPDEVDGARDLRLGCEVDGVVRQDARTSDLVHPPAAIVAYISSIITLEPGDVISMGTPAGVAAGQDPPQFLRPGQRVRTWIEGIGELLNECRPEADAAGPHRRLS
jgi:acylpyruvate hydrolase